MEKKYRIVKQEYFDESGNVENNSYKIQKHSDTLFGLISWWDNITKPSYEISTPIEFLTVEKAQAFIQNILCPGIPRNKWVITPIREVKCDNDK